MSTKVKGRMTSAPSPRMNERGEPVPTSYYYAVPCIVDRVVEQRPGSILDLGVGFGKYGVVLREVLDIAQGRYHKAAWRVRLEGVEGCAAYRNPVHDYVYDKVHYGLIEEVLPGLGAYDVVLAIDVIEHFDKGKGALLLSDMLGHASTALIVSTPVIPAVLPPYLGNDLELHRSRWSKEDFERFRHRYDCVWIGAGHRDGAQVVTIYPGGAVR